MRDLMKFLAYIVFIAASVSCEEDIYSEHGYPRVKTQHVSDISENGVRFSAEIYYRGDSEIISYGFVWDRITNPTIEDSPKVEFAGNIKSRTFSAKISSNLTLNKYFYVKAFVKTNDYIVYGQWVEFLSLTSEE
jgi:hypothetical protein